MRNPHATILIQIAISLTAGGTLTPPLIRLVQSEAQAAPPPPPIPRPDMVPVDDQGNPPMGQNPVRYCIREPRTGALLVKVKNQGTAPAESRGTAPMAVCATFTWHHFYDQFPGIQRECAEMGSIGPGETRTQLIPNTIPDACYEGSQVAPMEDLACNFTIRADPERQERTERITSNNTAIGRCLP